MSIIDYSPIIFLMLAAMTYLISSKLHSHFIKIRQLDKKIGKEYTILNQKNKGTARTYNTSTGELVSETGLDDYYERMKRENETMYERLMERRSLITEQQLWRLQAQGRDIIGGAESHLKPVESKPKGYDVKDQFDGVP